MGTRFIPALFYPFPKLEIWAWHIPELPANRFRKDTEAITIPLAKMGRHEVLNKHVFGVFWMFSYQSPVLQIDIEDQPAAISLQSGAAEPAWRGVLLGCSLRRCLVLTSLFPPPEGVSLYALLPGAERGGVGKVQLPFLLLHFYTTLRCYDI